MGSRTETRGASTNAAADESARIVSRRATTSARKKDIASPPATPKNGTSPRTRKAELTADDHHRLVSEAAYFISERRGFAPGAELDDWLQAEAEISRRPPRKNGRSPR